MPGIRRIHGNSLATYPTASEFDSKDTFLGIVNGSELELRYFSLKELQEVTGPLGLRLERDLFYEPKSLKVLIEWHKKQRGE